MNKHISSIFMASTLLGISATAAEQAPYTLPAPTGDGITAPTGLEWQQEQNLSHNKENARAYFTSFADVKSALGILPENSKYWQSLNGTWKFHWAKDPDSRPKDFFKQEYNSATWRDIQVPSSWQTQGYGTPIYSNQPYPFERNWPYVMTEPKDKKFTSLTARNPVGSYLRNFEVSADWKNREVYMQFDGVDSFFYLWINGKYVGFSKDSRNPASFNISPYLKPGKNTVAVEVYRHSDGAYLECQDMFRLSGIFRTVAIYALPTVHIRDFFVHVQPSAGKDWALTTRMMDNPGEALDKNWELAVDVDVSNLFPLNKVLDGFTVSMQLYTTDGTLVQPIAPKDAPWDGITTKELRLTGANQFQTSLLAHYASPALWSPENPNLYTLALTLKNKEGKEVEVVSAQVGFRNVVIKDSFFYVNGKPIKLKGVNRHETNPSTGHFVSREQMEHEVQLMKRANINHVRNSHYPADPYFYFLCNKYGISLQDEANIESHGYFYDKLSLSHPTEWMPAHVDRVMNMVERNKNHPSILMWSLGNEAGPGRNFQVAERTIKARDLSRPTHYERNNDITDFGSNQYPSITWTKDMAANKDFSKPYYISEYAHNMNNAMGNLADYWLAIESSDRICGASIWDWIDQGLYKTLPDGTKQICYGGDFGDAPNSGQFVMNGTILSDTTPQPGYFEVHHVYQNIKAEKGENANSINVFNKQFFSDLSAYDCVATVLVNGKQVATATLPLPDIAARETKNVPLPPEICTAIEKDAAPENEVSILISFNLRADTIWAKKGFAIAHDQISIKEPTPYPTAIKVKGLLKVATIKRGTTVGNDSFSATFDKGSGALTSYKYKGAELLMEPLAFNAVRCASSNEPGVLVKSMEQGLRILGSSVISQEVSQPAPTTGSVIIRQSLKVIGKQAEKLTDFGANKTTIEAKGEPISDANTHFIVNQQWTIEPDGTVLCQTVFLPRGMPIDLMRIGYEVTLPATMNQVEYFGRGPQENYADRKSGMPIARYKTTTQDSFFPYARPQDTGNHEETRWVALSNAKGVGLEFIAPINADPFAFSALPYTTSELILAMHPNALPAKPNKSILILSAATRGLGGASCGPGPLERDILKCNRAYEIAFEMRPFANGLPSGTRPTVLDANLDKSLVKRANQITIKACSSQELEEGDAEKVVDGDPSTLWHSEYNKTMAKFPHTLDFDLGKTLTLQSITSLPRQDGNANGRIADYEVYTSINGNDWVIAAKGKFPNSATLQEVKFSKPTSARYVRFKAMSEQSGKDFASMAEFDIIPSETAH